MKRNIIETVLGAVVLVVAGFFLLFAYSSAQFETIQGYEVTAHFDDLGGLKVGNAVRIGGVDVGRVSNVALDTETFSAQINITLDHDIRIPDDTTAIIMNESLLGGKFLALEVGGSEDLIPIQDGHIEWTETSTILEQVIGEDVFNLLQSFGQSQESDETTN